MKLKKEIDDFKNDLENFKRRWPTFSPKDKKYFIIFGILFVIFNLVDFLGYWMDHFSTTWQIIYGIVNVGLIFAMLLVAIKLWE